MLTYLKYFMLVLSVSTLANAQYVSTRPLDGMQAIGFCRHSFIWLPGEARERSVLTPTHLEFSLNVYRAWIDVDEDEEYGYQISNAGRILFQGKINVPINKGEQPLYFQVPLEELDGMNDHTIYTFHLTGKDNCIRAVTYFRPVRTR